jgi:hypothetical protein
VVNISFGEKGKDTLLVETSIGGKRKGLLLVETGITQFNISTFKNFRMD